MTADNYDASTALTSYYQNRLTNRPARHWAKEKLVHDLAAVGLLSFFEGPGPNPMALSGASTAKLWLDADAGVTNSSGTFKRYTGVGVATDENNWVAVTPGAYLQHLGGLSPVTSVENFGTRTAAAAATISSGVTYVETAGYTAPGDGGGGIYAKVLAEPAHAGKFQSVDGAWWELSDPFPNVRQFGAVGDAVPASNTGTDDTTAFQNAIDYAAATGAQIGASGVNALTSTVLVPPGVYRVSGLTITSPVSLIGSTVGMDPREVVLFHNNLAASMITLSNRASMSGFRVVTSNTNRTTPTVAPPTIKLGGAYVSVSDIRFEDAYIGIGNESGTPATLDATRIFGFVHHRMIYLAGALEIARLTHLHSQNPDGAAWDTGWYSFNNKILVEIEDVDGVYGDTWYSFAGRGLFKHSGTGNLIVTLKNVGAERITHGIEIVSGSTNLGGGVYIDGGYLSTNNRSDGVYCISNGADVHLTVSDMAFFNTANADCITVGGSGTTIVKGSTFLGTAGAKALHKTSATSRLVVSGCEFSALAYVLYYETGCDTLVHFDEANRVRTGGGFFRNTNETGVVDVSEPALYETTNAHTQSTRVRRTMPSHEMEFFVNQYVRAHEVAASSLGSGGWFEATAANNGGAYSPGSKARFKCYNTSATPSSEAGRARIQGYSAGTWGTPVDIDGSGFVIFNDSCRIAFGSGTPEGAISAPVGSIFLRTDGGAATSFYVKEAGSGNTGWVGK